MALVASLVLTIKASNDPTHDESVSENPTGRVAVYGHPKVAAGSSSYRQAPPPYLYKPPKYNSEPHYHDTYKESNDVSGFKDEYHSSEKEEAPLMSSEAASEEHPMPPVMTEDNAMMLSEELNNAPESNEAMIEEMSVHEEMISVHEFKEVLDEVVNDAVDKIVMKKAGIVGKLKTAKQNFIGHIGEATSRDPQQRCLTMEQCAAFAVMTGTFIPDPCPVCPCKCDENTFDEFGRGDCNSDVDGLGVWCFLESKSFCTDQRPSKKLDGRFWSRQACSLREEMRKFQEQ